MFGNSRQQIFAGSKLRLYYESPRVKNFLCEIFSILITIINTVLKKINYKSEISVYYLAKDLYLLLSNVWGLNGHL